MNSNNVNLINNNSNTSSATESTTSGQAAPPGTTKTCILHKDEKGFGLKVSGSNPVFVAEVKAGGSAQKAGVCKNDIIFKVNGSLATKWPHEKVVQLIQGSGGPFVVLTLIVPPPPTATTNELSSNNQETPITNNINNNPQQQQPVNGQQQQLDSINKNISTTNVVQNIIPKHLAENTTSSVIVNVNHQKSQSIDGSSSTSKTQQQQQPVVSISCPFPLQPHPSVTTMSGSSCSAVSPTSLPGRKGSAPAGGLTITAPLPASPEVQAGLEKSRDKTLRSMIKTQKSTIIALRSKEEAARKDQNHGLVSETLAKIEEAENTIKVLKKRLKNMQRNRNKQKAEMLFPSSTYFDTSASTTHLLIGADGSTTPGSVDAGNLNPAFLQGSPPPSNTSNNSSSSLLWGQRQQAAIPHLANPAMIHRRRSGGEGISRNKNGKKDPKDWFRDDHSTQVMNKQSNNNRRHHHHIDILHFESDHEDDGTCGGKEHAFSDQPGLDIGHGGHVADGVLLRSSKAAASNASKATQRSKSSLSSIFLGLNKKSNASSSSAVQLLAPIRGSQSGSGSHFLLADTSTPSTTDSDDSDLMSSSSSSSDDDSDSDDDSSEESQEEEDLREEQEVDLMKLDEETPPIASNVSRSASSASQKKSSEVVEVDEFHSARNSEEEDDEETSSCINKLLPRSSSIELSSNQTGTNAASVSAEDRMKRRINKRRTSSNKARGGSSGFGSSNEDSIGSKERKQIETVLINAASDEGGQRSNKGSNVSTSSSETTNNQNFLSTESKNNKKQKNLSNVSTTSEEGTRHNHRSRSSQEGTSRVLSAEELKKRMKIRRNLKLRRMKMRELIKTEKKFGNDLKLLHDLFYHPLKQELDKKKFILNASEMDILFANLIPLIELQRALYKFLKNEVKPLISSGIKRDRVDYELIGNKLVEIFSSLKLKLITEFALYCSIQEKQNELLASKSASSKFGQFRKTAELHAKEVLNKLTLKDLLMAPVQRIMRYRLLIHSVFETFPSTSSSNYTSLERRTTTEVDEQDKREERRKRKAEDTERKGRASLEKAVKVVQEIAKGVDDKKAESERLDWISKQLFPSISHNSSSSSSTVIDTSSSSNQGHDNQYVHGSRVITSMDSLILEHEGSVEWKLIDGTYLSIHLLLLRDFIVLLNHNHNEVAGTPSSTSSLSPSSGNNINNVPSNPRQSSSLLLSNAGHPMSLACLSKQLPPTASVSLAKLNTSSHQSQGMNNDDSSVIPITTDLIVKPIAAMPKAFYLVKAGNKTTSSKAFMHEISTPDVEQCSIWMERINHLVRMKSSSSSSLSSSSSNLVRLAPTPTTSSSSIRGQQQQQFTPHPRFRHGIHRHNHHHQQQQELQAEDVHQNEVNKQRLQQLRNRPLPPPPPPYCHSSSSQPQPPARSDSIPSQSGPRYVGRIEVMEPKGALNDFKSCVQVSGPTSASNDSYSYRFNSDPGLVNNDFYFDYHCDEEEEQFSVNLSDNLVEINRQIGRLLLKKQQIVSSNSNNLPLGATSLVFLTNQLVKESLDVESAFLSSTSNNDLNNSNVCGTRRSNSVERRGSKKGSQLNDSISIEDSRFEEEKNKIREKFTKILFQNK